MPLIFREIPPITLVTALLQTIGLTGLEDATWFSKQQIQLAKFEEYLPELEAFYIPCKAVDYLHKTLTPTRAITILRQVLRTQGAYLQATERSTGGAKTTWYQVLQDSKNNKNSNDKEICIEFI